MAKTALEKLAQKKDKKVVVLDHGFAGIKAGEKMFVATPQIIDRYIRAIPFGETRTVVRLRNELARRHRCDAACPMSTSIFVRISAEAALEELAQGKSVEDVAPFWRVLTSKDKITKKLDVDPAWVDQQRELEAADSDSKAG